MSANEPKQPPPAARALRAALEAGRVADGQVVADVPALLRAAADRLHLIADGLAAAAETDGATASEFLLAAQLQVAVAERASSGAALGDLHDLLLTLIQRLSVESG